MGRTPRFIPPGGLVEITNRTLQGRRLLKPSPTLNQLVIGVLARAQRHYDIPIHAFVFMSNHYHLLLSPPDAERLSRFMGFLNTNLSKIVGKLYGWKGPMWQRRYDDIPVSDEEAAQVDRLNYVLSHGCKEGFVMTPQDWPGVHSIHALVEGKPMQGLWLGRSAHPKGASDLTLTEQHPKAVEETITLTPLPAWSHLSAKHYRQRIQELVSAIQETTRARHDSLGTQPMGTQVIAQASPEERPSRPLEAKPKPRFHAFKREVKKQMESQFQDWLTAYREASRLWRSGELDVRFPCWSFPPAPRYVRAEGLVPDSS